MFIFISVNRHAESVEDALTTSVYETFEEANRAKLSHVMLLSDMHADDINDVLGEGASVEDQIAFCEEEFNGEYVYRIVECVVDPNR